VGPPSPDQDGVAAKYDGNRTCVPPATSDCPAACAIYSSVSDLIRFAALHLGQRSSVSTDPELLSSSSLRCMQTPSPGTVPTRDWECEGGGYGIGWFIGFLGNGLKIVDHSGGACGIGTSLILVPEEHLAVAVLTNTHGSWADNIAISAVSALIPHHLVNVCTPSESGTASVHGILATEPILEGTWSGSIETCERDISLRLRVDDEGRAWIRIAGAPEQRLEDVSYVEGSTILMNAGGGPSLRGAVQGGLPTSAVLRGCPCRTWIELKLNQDRLQGAVICLSQRGFWTGPLSAWAELARIEEEG
ncbi:beta-lactamase family protein, partial [Candidatus Bipolaricaulota bacterium]|nr:beta-lactamase family protein [Candidatus Bipolaricaulota bacterium]